MSLTRGRRERRESKEDYFHERRCFFRRFSAQVRRDFAELFKGGFEILDDFLSGHTAIREFLGSFKAFVSEPEDVEDATESPKSHPFIYPSPYFPRPPL